MSPVAEQPSVATAVAGYSVAGSSVAGSPRRERKKQQTRDALVRAAMRLFDAKGYEHTAVREITDAVDVSERTFFRYFANKEDLAVSFARDATDSLVRELVARPPDEAPLTALRNAFHEAQRTLAEDDGPHAEESMYLLVIRLIDSTPSLLAAHLRYMHDHEDDIVGVLASREGVDPETDPRPRIVAMVFGGLTFLANRDWRARGGGSVASMLAAFDAFAEQVGPAVSGHWS